LDALPFTSVPSLRARAASLGQQVDGDAALFSLKCLLAGAAAFYAAAEIGLSHPYWAVTTTYIVGQPLSGAVLSKAIYRLMGTLLGATAAVLLLPNFVNEPLVLSFALAVWLGICVYLAVLDRSPRAYTFLLAGYTASIIGFPTVDTPGDIFLIAILRVQEIVLGIVISSAVHGLILPRTVSAQLRRRIGMILDDARQWSLHALAGEATPALRRWQIAVAQDLGELDQLATHLPFDTDRDIPNVKTLRSLQDHLALLLPTAGSVDDRLLELRRIGDAVPPPVAEHVAAVTAWLEAGADAAAGRALLVAGQALTSHVTLDGQWRSMVLLSLLKRMEGLVSIHREARLLAEWIMHPEATRSGEIVRSPTARRARHRDPILAARVAAATVLTVFLGCVFWISTAWTDGAQAVLMAGICCALFGNLERPAAATFQYIIGFSAGIAIATIYAFAILPRATDYVTVVAVTAPALLVLGSMLARPKLARLSAGGLVAFPNLVGFNLAYDPDFARFINTAIAQLVGAGFACVMLNLSLSLEPGNGVPRLRRAAFRDIARRALGASPDSLSWLGRMLDRIDLILARMQERQDQDLPVQALANLRIGYVAGEVESLSQQVNFALASGLRRIVQALAAYYRRLDPLALADPPTAILTLIDEAVSLLPMEGDEVLRREASILLTGLRRNLFPKAHGFVSPPVTGPAVTV
jgi:uncharacterized membrane protein YccC